jgi:acyl transferase domain-containing protein
MSNASNADEIRAALLQLLAEHLRLAPADIDEQEPFSSYGVSSVAAATIAGELADRLGRTIDPLALFEHPCVAALVSHLAMPGARPAGGAPTQSAQESTNEPIAIVGMACRMPGGPTKDLFWQELLAGTEAISAVPPHRWRADDSTGRFGGFIDGVDLFDNQFFRIFAAEAARMDPQQRLLLEVSWHALEDSGIVPDTLQASRAGVFVGASFSDYGMAQLASVNGHALNNTGSALALLANRLSYFYDLRGPSMTVDTACSSALVATHLAVRAIRSGECDVALVGAVNLLLAPQISRGLVAAGLLAADGRCKPFDARANGYVRAEGCGVLILKPLNKARRDKDRIYAAIRGSAVSQDGRTNGLGSPNPLAQRAVLSAAYADAAVAPKDVGYVECHGIGTPLGDRIEATALGAVVGKGSGRAAEHPCLIGSVKGNVGHPESAAGIAGLIKAALVLHTGVVPPSVNFTQPNPGIPFDQLGLRVASGPVQFLCGSAPFAGVSGFGFGGTNAHVILEAPPEQPVEVSAAPTRYLVLPVSARTEAALTAARADWADAVGAAGQDGAADLVSVAALRRTHHRLRTAVVGSNAGELANALRHGGNRIHTQSGTPKLIFVFPGDGAQSEGLLRELAAERPLVLSVLARCDEALAEHADWSLRVLAVTAGERLVTDAAVSQPALCATQIAMSRFWRSMGVEPLAVLGHGVGEIAAAETAGILDLPTAMRLAYLRGRLLARSQGHGRMLVVGLAEVDAAALATSCDVDLAAVNGPDTTVLSGAADKLDEIAKTLAADGVFTRWLDGEYALPGRPSQRASEDSDESVAEFSCGLQPHDGSIPFVSSTLGAVCDGRSLDAAYWGRNISQTVRFAAGLHAALGLGADTVLEVGARPTLTNPIRRAVKVFGAEGVTVLPTAPRVPTCRGDELLLTYQTLADLYARGCNIRWAKNTKNTKSAAARFLSAPQYPFDRSRHWLNPPATAGVTGRAADSLVGSELDLSNCDGRRVWEVVLGLDSSPRLGAYRVGGTAALPVSAVIEGALKLATAVGLDEAEVADVVVHELVPISDEPIVAQWTVIPNAAGQFALTMHARRNGNWRLHATASLRPPIDAMAQPVSDCPASARIRCVEHVSPGSLYQALAAHGLDCGTALRGVREVWRHTDEAVGRISLDNGDNGDNGDPIGLLEATFHLAAAAAGAGTNGPPALIVPVGIEFVRRGAGVKLPCDGEATASLRPSCPDGIVCDATLFDSSGAAVLVVGGLRFGALGRAPLPAGPVRRPRPDIGEYIAPRSVLEQRIADIWTRLLDLEKLSVCDGFFQLGGDSIFASQMMLEVNRTLGVQIQPARAFDALTVAGLADLAEQEMLERLADMTDEEALALVGSGIGGGPKPSQDGEQTLSAQAAVLARWRNGDVRLVNPVQPTAGAPTRLAECSVEQQFMWDRQQDTPEKTMYNIGYCARLDARLDAELFGDCLAAMSMRHETLRTRIEPTSSNVEPKVAQLIEPDPQFGLDVIDLREHGVGEAESVAIKLAEALLRKPFDLISGPLVRVTLYRIADNADVLAIVAHHLIADGWSFDVALSELAEFYRAKVAGERPQLPPVPLQYRDFARWQASWLSRGDWRRDLDYCREKLAGLAHPLLPWDREPPVDRSYRCAHKNFELTAAQSTLLRDFSRGEGASLFMTMLACFKVLLARTTGADDVAVGVPMVNRQHQQTQRVIGYFSNITVVRTDLHGSATFRDVLARVRSGVLGALSHQSLPLPLYLEAEGRELDQRGKRNWPSLVSRPIYRAQYNFRPPVKLTELAGAVLQPRHLNREFSTYDFTLLMEDADPLYGKFEYAMDVFDASTVDRLARTYFDIVDQVMANPSARIADLVL